MKALGTLWSFHVLSLLAFIVRSYEVFTLSSNMDMLLFLALVFSALAYLVQLGREAVKRKRRWVVWCGLAPVVPFWVALSFPIFYFVTRDDEQTN